MLQLCLPLWWWDITICNIQASGLCVESQAQEHQKLKNETRVLNKTVVYSVKFWIIQLRTQKKWQRIKASFGTTPYNHTQHPLTLAGWLQYINVWLKVLFTGRCHISTMSVVNSLHDCHSHYIWRISVPSDIYVWWFFHMSTSICHTNTLFIMNNF